MHSPNVLSRRHLLKSSALGFGGLALADLLQRDSSAAQQPPQPHFAPRARHVIFLFMGGGPSHLDMFDPKPEIERYQGQRPSSVDLRTERVTGGLLASPFPFRPGGESGIPVSDLLPHVREYADELCVVRSMYAVNPNHGPALNFMISGRIDSVHPALGAWVSYGLGTENRNLPGFVALGSSFVSLSRNGYLPGEHQATPIDVRHQDPEQMVRYLRNADLTLDEQEQQLAFLNRLNAEHLADRGQDAQLEARIRAMETAFRMQMTGGEALDVRSETQATLDAYGSGPFANACLLARRLVERGVRFVQVHNGGWDHHTAINKNLKEKCSEIDRPIAALLGDLKRRGLLEETLVVWGGEFGRTPVSENGNGRDHNHYGFTMWLAGGGVRGGMCYGTTDEFGFRAVQNPVSVHDLHATILHLLGLDHERLTYHYSGRDFRLTDVHGRILREILA